MINIEWTDEDRDIVFSYNPNNLTLEIWTRHDEVELDIYQLNDLTKWLINKVGESR